MSDEYQPNGVTDPESLPEPLSAVLRDVHSANLRLSLMEERFHQLEEGVLRTIEARLAPGYIIRACAEYLSSAIKNYEDRSPQRYFLHYVPDAGLSESVAVDTKEEVAAEVRKWIARREPFVFRANDGVGLIHLCDDNRYVLFPDGTRLSCSPDTESQGINETGRVGGLPMATIVAKVAAVVEGGEDDDDDDEDDED